MIPIDKLFFQVLQPVSQNKNYPAVFLQNDKNSEDFFVFKRRRLDICTGEGKIKKKLID